MTTKYISPGDFVTLKGKVLHTVSNAVRIELYPGFIVTTHKHSIVDVISAPIEVGDTVEHIQGSKVLREVLWANETYLLLGPVDGTPPFVMSRDKYRKVEKK